MVVRNLFIILVAVVLLVQPPLAAATVATGAVTGRGVFNLTTSGASKVASAEVTIAKAVRVLGLLGRYAGYAGLAFALYDIAANTWDWWNQEYNLGAAAPVAPGEGSAGVAPVGAGTGWINGPFHCADGFSGAADPIPAGVMVTGITSHSSASSFGGAHGTCSWYDINWIELSSLPTASVSAAPGGPTNRAEFVAQVDGAIADLTAAANGVISGVTVPMGQTFDATVALLRDARALVSNGLSLTSSDYTQGSNFPVGSTSLPGNDVPAAIPGGAETTTAPTQSPPAADSSVVVAAVSSASAAISAAVAASGAAVVSAVNAVAAAVAAAAVATYTPIVAAVTASQAAVVSAVQAIAAPIVTAINEAKTDIVSAVSSAPAGGGSAGTTTAVESLAAQETARNAAAESAAAAAAPADVICPECVREDKWSEAWGTLAAAGQAAPVFGLINRIVINPVGTIERVRTVNTANFGALTFNLNQWGIDTYIGVIRYVVIFVALIAGYFVIFG